MRCRSCGAELDGHETICPGCGRKLAPPAQVSSQAARRYQERIRDGERMVREGRGPQERRQQTGAASRRTGDASASDNHPTADHAGDAPASGDHPPARRRRASSSRRPLADTPSRDPAQSASMPPSRQEKASAQAGRPPVRMVRRYRYEAIEPETEGYENFNWVRLCVVSFLCVLVLTVGAYLFLSYTSMGQLWLATMGREASAEAYHTLGRQHMSNGSIARAVDALEIAQSKDPNNLEILVDLGRAYMGNGQAAAAELAYTRAIQYWPAYPDPYRLLVDIMVEQGRNYEAVQCILLAIEETGDNDGYFNGIYQQMLPGRPNVDILAGRYDQEISLTLSCEEGGTIYYTILGEDPLASGVRYEEPIYLEEGVWRLRAVTEKNGVYSQELVQSYTVSKPVPDMPKASLQSGTYDSVRTVSLRAGSDTVIYYTIDGTQPTTESKQYNPDEPIQLRIGKTVIRAIAVNIEGKKSNELNIEYECGGRTAYSMNAKDTVGDLALFETTQSEFVALYGQPQSEQSDGRDALGTYTKLTYAFGYATFLDRGTGGEPVLAELSTRSPDMAGPRSTAVGMRAEEVLSAFRDVGGEANIDGDRVLYTIRTMDTNAIGLLTYLQDNPDYDYQIGYWVKVQNTQQFIELSYYVKDGLVVRMDWLRYESA